MRGIFVIARHGRGLLQIFLAVSRHKRVVGFLVVEQISQAFPILPSSTQEVPFHLHPTMPESLQNHINTSISD